MATNRPILPSTQSGLDGQARPSFSGPRRKPSSDDKPRRKIIPAACESCRKKKSRCNGERPICSACITRNSECQYDVEVGETRVQSLRTKKESLEKALATMLQVCGSLQSGTPAEVEATVARIRQDPEFAAALEAAMQSSGKASGPVPEAKVGLDTIHDAMESTSTLQQSVRPAPEPLQGGLNDSSKSSFRTLSTTEQSASSSSTQTNVSLSLQEGFSELPDKEVAYNAILNFYKCSGKLFHAFPKEHGIDIWRAVYERGENSNVRLAEMFSIMAIGSQYANEETGMPLGARSYHIAKSFLEDALEADRLQATRIIVCLAMYNIMNKSTVALSYIELGLSIMRRFGLHERSRSTDIAHSTWWEMKKVWRSLMFLESWLTSSLGYMSDSSSTLSIHELLKEMEIPDDPNNGLFDAVQSEMAKVSILTARVIRVLYTSDITDMDAAASVTSDLRQWHKELPSALQIPTVTNYSSPPELLVPIYFIHLIHFGALMLIYRRIMFHTAQRDDILSILAQDDIYRQVSIYSQEGINAAKSSAVILGKLHDDKVIFKKCWLVIFHSFSSAVVILHDITQKWQRNVAIVNTEEEFELVENCLHLLAFSADLDPVAKHFLQTLTPYYEYLRWYEGAATGKTTFTMRSQSPSHPKDLASAAQSLLDLVRTPFGDMEAKRNLDPRLSTELPPAPVPTPPSRGNSFLLPDRQPLPQSNGFHFNVPSPFNAPESQHLGASSRLDMERFGTKLDYSHMTGGFIFANAPERMGWFNGAENYSYTEDVSPARTKRGRMDFTDFGGA